MTGAIITSSGEQHRGFHQSPNVLRDKYMPKIGGDGYGYLNYLLSWANADTTLSVRRMKRDLGWSQDKLERVQDVVLVHCSHFVSMTPGDRVTANRWHLDMEKVWLENVVHLAQGAAQRLAELGVPKSGKARGRPKKGVPEIGTGGVPEIGTGGVPEIGTYKEKGFKEHSLNKKRGVIDVTGSPREGDQPSAPVAELSPAAHSSSGDLKDLTHEGLRMTTIVGAALASVAVVPQVEGFQPDGAAVAAGQEILVDPQDLAEPQASVNEQATFLEKFPAGAAGAGGEAAEGPCGAGEGVGRVGVDAIRPVDAQELAGRPVEPVDGEAHAALKSLVGGKNLTQLTKELTRTGGLSREPWFKLTAGEIGLVQKLAQAEAKATGGNMLTLAVRGLDRLIGAVRVEKSAAAKAAAAEADPQLLAGLRCMVLETDAGWVQGVVEEVHEVQYRIVLDDRSVRRIDRTSAAKLQTLRASDAPAPTAVAPAPEGLALFAPVGSSWRRVTGKGGQVGEVITVQAVLGTKRKLSNGGELAFYTIQKDFELVVSA